MSASHSIPSGRVFLSTALCLTGRDALGVLHRIATQFLADLEPGDARSTCFCDFRGRLLHRAVVVRDLDGAVWLLRPDAPGTELAEFVDRHVFREDVHVEDRGVDAFVTAAYEPTRAASRPASLADATASSSRSGAAWNVPVRPGVALVVEHAPAAGAEARDRSDLDRERDRIASGEPRHGREISDTFTPFEVGLAHEVHLSKGCFTGQEALMRLVTYRSVRRRLYRLAGNGAPPAEGTELRPAAGRAGALTSVVAVAGGWTGLAVLPPGIGPHDLAESLAPSTCDPVNAGAPLGLPEGAMPESPHAG